MAVILDMEMPKGKCWWHDENGKEHECQLFPCGVGCFDSDFREKSCLIIGEIPDKHGRLIDADKMELDFKATVVNCIEKDPNRADQYKEAERLVLGILKRTHNVLPASEGE